MIKRQDGAYITYAELLKERDELKLQNKALTNLVLMAKKSILNYDAPGSQSQIDFMAASEAFK